LNKLEHNKKELERKMKEEFTKEVLSDAGVGS